MAIILTDPTAKALRSYMTQIDGQFANINNLLTIVGGFIWRNPNGKTPQQVFDLIGKDGVELADIADDGAALVLARTGQAVQVVPNGYTLTRNKDGTVTVSGAPA